MEREGRSTRVDDAYHRLKTELRENRLPAGYMAPETDVAAQLGMSRTPVREALIRLESEGLIELIPRRGMRVLPIQPEDMREIYEILSALEPEAAAALAKRGPSDHELAPLVAATEEMERAITLKDLDAWALADDRFHRTLLHLHGNDRMSDIVEVLYDQAHRARMITLRLRELPVKSTGEHRVILEHLRAGNADGARTVFRAHRRRTVGELMTVLETLKFAQL